MPRKRRKRKLNIKGIFFVFIIFLALFSFLIFNFYNDSLKAPSKVSEEVVFTVNSGDSTKKVLNNLKTNGLIKNIDTALIYIKLNNLSNIKAGDYILNKNWNVKEIFEFINNSTNAISDDVKVTIIEGDWAKDIAKKISEKLGISSDELINLWNDENYIRSIMVDYPFLTEEIFNENVRIKLEGYLFPETYLFAKDSTKEEVTKKLLDQTLKVYKEYKDKIDSSNLSVHKLFTLASIVQYEASKEEDMKLIAGVFYNRLNINMKLQSSVTVCYAIDKEKNDDWMKCEVNPNFDSPYNTYKYNGLPPGPILNPGKVAIEATLNPSNSNYLYFMADVYGDGKVYYAETYEEHSKNVRKYLR